ncbi:MAG: S1 RNA-binding domain-containing protein [Oscillospiraceae bacterium]|nr:S1 RNA-binding domain-containing protein [Oscillospiraceae bacterium]
MNAYLPEGRNPRPSPYTAEELKTAMFSGEILEGVAVKCDERHNLLVDLGCATGIILRQDAAVGIREGTLRDIAILSRVGKPVSFQVLDLPEEEPPVLSRRAAQEEALSHFLRTLSPGDILPATVSNLTAFGAFCDIGCGIPALLGIENISVSRIAHSRDRFQEGERIYVAVKLIDRENSRIFLTHKELLGTWEENAAVFQQGQTVTGVVRSVKAYGAFIELLPNLSGLADPNPSLREGDAVCVYIKSILPDKQKIKLVALHRLEPGAVPPAPLTYYLTCGHLDRWVYSPQQITVF